MKKAQLTQATEYGRQAFLNGVKRVPAWDKNVISMVAGRGVGQSPEGEAKTSHIFKAWTSGWDSANLKAASL